MQCRFKMEYRLFTIVRYNYRDYNKEYIIGIFGRGAKFRNVEFVYLKKKLFSKLFNTLHLESNTFIYDNMLRRNQRNR